jgi:hypothetical protein
MNNVRFARLRSRALMTTAALCALSLAACSQEPASESAAADAATEAAPAPAASARADSADNAAAPASGEARDAASIPGTTTAAANGVAFIYRFAFRLPDDQVSEAQDRHLRACERIGPARCQVTDIFYERSEDGPIEARAAFLLDPVLARGFVRDAADAVGSLEGETVSSNVSGEELASGIDASQAASARMGGDLSRLEARLARPGLSKGERDDIEAQIARLRGELRTEEDGRRNDEARLATTPVAFDYTGNTGIAGVDRNRPFASAWDASTRSFGTASAFVMTLIGLILPWALMIGSVVFGVRWLRRRFAGQAAPAAE